MKNILRTILITLIALLVTYYVATKYAEKIEKIEKGEIIQVSESYMDR